MKKYILLPILLATSTTVFANDVNFSTNISVSNFNSNSEQYIYGSYGKISQLSWEVENTKLLGVGANIKFYKDFSFFANYKKNITNESGQLDDYDWLDSNNPDIWTDWSTHPNTKVDKVTIFDLGFFDSIKINDNFSTNILFGYKNEEQVLKAYDGSYIYTTNSLRDTTGTFEGLGITYTQKYQSLYLGLGFDTSYEDFNFNFTTKYSPKVIAEFTDRHHFRNFTDITSFEDTTMLSFYASAS
jgi:outer membrane protease